MVDSITRTLTGGSESSSNSQNSSGFGALPMDIQNRFRQISNQGAQLIQNPSQFFGVQGIGANENQALGAIQGLLNPSNITQGVEGFLNPYRDIITSDINRQFEDSQGALASQISEAGAFGSSRSRDAQGDLERARLDAIAGAQSGQFNNALNQYLGTQQQGISNLLGFGQLERGVDQHNRQVLPQALQAYSNLINPLFGSSEGTSQSESSSVGGFSSFFGG